MADGSVGDAREVNGGGGTSQAGGAREAAGRAGAGGPATIARHEADQGGAAQPSRDFRVLVAQLNLVVGDIRGNASRIAAVLREAGEAGVDLAVFPELAIPGYPPEDLLLRASFLAANEAAVRELAGHTRGLTAVVGFANRDGDLHNAAAILHDGELVDVVHKAYLPNYGVFDEARYFSPGERFPVFERSGVRIGVSVCEDIWHPSGPPHHQAGAGAEVLVNISASPYARGKGEARRRMLTTRALDDRAFVVFCNLVGGQDELVFDGHSLVIDPAGQVLARGPSFAEDVLVVDLRPEEAYRERLLDPRRRQARTAPDCRAATPLVPLVTVPARERPRLPARPEPQELRGPAEVYAALVLGVRDYVAKNGFERSLVGLSGGVDSALTAVIAVDALGAAKVDGVAMPTRYSSPISLEDARHLAESLGIELLQVPVDDIFQAYLDALEPLFAGRAPDTTEENIQPRIRGNVLMALSNKLGHLVLTTGNKSETSVGYTTLYGDTAGGFAPLKDVPKTLVYELARWRNARDATPVIPERTLERPPTAELKPDQTDQDTLPPYDVLDSVLAAYVEDEMDAAAIVALGFEADTVQRVIAMVDRAEYKRRQSPPGIKISERAFGRDRRMPISKRGRW